MKKNVFFIKVIIVLAIIFIIGLLLIVHEIIKPGNVLWDIKIYELWNNPLAGKRLHDNRYLYIDPNNCIVQVHYDDENNNAKVLNPYLISKQDIDKIINLAEMGTETFDKKDDETFTVYRIQIKSKIVYVDSKLDKENVISSLFKD